MRRLVPIVVVLVVAAMLLATVTPAFACSCAPRSVEGNVDYYDAIVVGQVTEVFPTVQPNGIAGGPMDLDARVQVEAYYKGSGPADIVVDDPIGDGDCGFISEAAVGSRYLLFLTTATTFPGSGQQVGAASTFFTHLCAGNVQLFDRGTSDSHPNAITDVEALTGPGQPPDDVSPQPESIPTTTDSGGFPREAMWLAAAILPLAFLAAATLAPWRRR